MLPSLQAPATQAVADTITTLAQNKFPLFVSTRVKLLQTRLDASQKCTVYSILVISYETSETAVTSGYAGFCMSCNAIIFTRLAPRNRASSAIAVDQAATTIQRGVRFIWDRRATRRRLLLHASARPMQAAIRMFLKRQCYKRLLREKRESGAACKVKDGEYGKQWPFSL